MIIKTDEARIQYNLFTELIARGQYIILPNISHSWLYWEADLISITKAGYLHEYEIKTGLSDFKADFKKRKHRVLSRIIPRTKGTPNYFWYVAPEKTVPICIPDYAGLIIVEPDNRYEMGHKFVQIRKAKKIHGEKPDKTAIIKMLRTLMFKYWNLSNNLDNIKIQRDLFKKREAGG